MSSGQEWAAELIAEDNSQSSLCHHTSDYRTADEQHRHALVVLANQLDTVAGKVRALAQFAPGRGIAGIVLDLQDIAKELRGDPATT
jgi:hypothetical protein